MDASGRISQVHRYPREKGPESRKLPQHDRGTIHEKQRKAAEQDLIQSWQARLQLISVITTFFATLEAELLGSVTPVQGHSASSLQVAAAAVLVGAFTVHLSAAILAFIASFFLIRYRLKEATDEELQVESRESSESARPWLRDVSPSTSVWSMNPHIAQVGPFRDRPPTRLLEHCHTLCMWFSLSGFVLALVGGLCYSWARLPQSASIVASVCLAVCWLASAGAVLLVL
ncbi:hypothetical protein DAEQUDRAFT_722901 [Daedalea quercina L-15889]|uniref:Uncharacterized protein n=1 Tax=Daedalea quercina L-15889 TaxID=1314783 RepID=A0A165SNB5_9APHY|nr:hypothetical protein DAEQUDRAFT_722901 [Daedalea quercina L-15889]